MALDAFGHLTWSVGNEDWVACFDAEVVGDALHYHVVVDCDSGGFTYTVERGFIPLSDHERLGGLRDLPDYYADLCREHYAHERARRYRVRARDLRATRLAWDAHLTRLENLGPCREDSPCGACEECCEDGDGPDPVRDGKDGRP